jgi:hypothetical protein
MIYNKSSLVMAMKGGRAKRDMVNAEEDPYNSKPNKELSRLLLTMKEVEDQIDMLKSDLGTLEDRYKRLQSKMAIHLLELQQIIVFMMTSSFFIKQLGYVTILKVWRIYVKEPEEVHFSFPPFLTPQLKQEVNTVVDLEAEDVRKETENNLTDFTTVIETEVVSKLKDMLNPNFGKQEDSKELFSALPKHAFVSIRNILLEENQNERTLIESTRKLQRMVMTAIQRQRDQQINNLLNKRQVQVLDDDKLSDDAYGDNPKAEFVVEESYVDMPAMPGGVHTKKGKGAASMLGRSITRMPTLDLSQSNKPGVGSQRALGRQRYSNIGSSRTDIKDTREGLNLQRTDRTPTQTMSNSRQQGLNPEKHDLKRVVSANPLRE